jgi:uncharacterized protein DUF3421
MRKAPYVAISITVALVLAFLATEMRTSEVTVKAETDSSMSPQHVPFLWLTPSDEKRYPTYKRVEGGMHADGTMMYVCRFLSIPGKLYKDGCHYSDGGYEYVRNAAYEVLVNDGGYVWTPVDNVSRSQIKKRALVGGENAQDASDTIYICRKKLKDGVHPGKYSYRNNYCYIPWGNKEIFYTKGYDILFFP